MATLSIQSNINLKTLEAFKSLFLSIDPQAKISIEDSKDSDDVADCEINEADKERFLETLRLYKEGKLEFVSFEEMKSKGENISNKLKEKYANSL